MTTYDFTVVPATPNELTIELAVGSMPLNATMLHPASIAESHKSVLADRQPIWNLQSGLQLPMSWPLAARSRESRLNQTRRYFESEREKPNLVYGHGCGAATKANPRGATHCGCLNFETVSRCKCP
jgi:hypothetical protein